LREPDYPRNKTQDKERRYDADELGVIVLVFFRNRKMLLVAGDKGRLRGRRLRTR
jgi:hypothetical protein